MQYRGNCEKRFGMTDLPLLRKMENATSRADPITAGASISSSTNVSTNKSSGAKKGAAGDTKKELGKEQMNTFKVRGPVPPNNRSQLHPLKLQNVSPLFPWEYGIM